MKVAGIIAEYNPFHNGHAAQIAATRAAGCTHVVVAMSGNFTQRGEPAVCHKLLRCRAALAAGADLVVELPLPWAVSSAEGFARGAVFLLESLGCVELLSFGSETGDVSAIAATARALEAAEQSEALRAELKTGASFPAARQRAAASLAPLPPRGGPNDLLAAEYQRALWAFGSGMRPFAVRRVGAAHDGEQHSGGVASASEIRRLLAAGQAVEAARFLPPVSARLLNEALGQGLAPFGYERFARQELSFLRRLTPQDFAVLDDVGEGLENRICAALRSACTLEELFALVKTKRYAMSRIRRVLLAAFLGVGGGFRRQQPPYLRVLGFNERGRQILAQAKHAARLPVVTRRAAFDGLDARAQEVFALECRAGDLYALGLPAPQPCGSEQRLSPVRASLSEQQIFTDTL